MRIMKTLTACIFILSWFDAATARDVSVINGIKVETVVDADKTRNSALVILSGSKGFGSSAYDEIARRFSQAGIDVYLANLLTDEDLHQIASLKTATQRIEFYDKRRSGWTASTIKLLNTLREHPQYRGRVALLGISRGAETAALAVSSGAHADAVVLVDGATSKQLSPGKLPPIQMIWGSRDAVFPLATAQHFARRVEKAGGPVTLSVFDGGHDFFLKPNTKQAIEAYETVIRFLQKTRK